MGAVSSIASGISNAASGAFQSATGGGGGGGGLFGAISDAFSSVGNAFTGVADTVTKTIDNTVKSIEANPVTAVADIAAIASGNPELVQYINPAIAVAQGADPTKVAIAAGEGYLGSLAGSQVGADVAGETGSPFAGNIAKGATSGLTQALISGRDPITAALSGGINTAANTGIADTLDTSIVPKVDLASVLLNPAATTKPTVRQPTTSGTTSPATQMASNNAGTLNLPGVSMGELTMPSLSSTSELKGTKTSTPAQQQQAMQQIYATMTPNSNANPLNQAVTYLASGGSTKTTEGVTIPTLSNLDTYSQINSSIDPTEELSYNGRLVTPTELSLLSPTPTAFAADGGHVHDLMSKMLPELVDLMKQRMHHYPDGGNVDSSLTTSGFNLSPDSSRDIQEALKTVKENAVPSFHIYQPTFLEPHSNASAPKVSRFAEMAEAPHMGTNLTQMGQGPLSSVLHTGLVGNRPYSGMAYYARGGLSKYEEAAPEGHHPEFITGVTGYYAGGRGTGQSDDIPAMLHDGDYVIDADAVAALGDGSSKAGNEALMHFMHEIPHHKHNDGNPVPAKIADGEVVLPESFVTALGHGDNKRGAKMLDNMREELREHKRSAPTSKIPPKAKSPLEYLKMAKG